MDMLFIIVIMLICIAILWAVLWTVQKKAILIEREYDGMCDRVGMERFRQWVNKQRSL